MAKQTSMIQFEGTVGNLCFYKTSQGYFVRSKGGASKSMIKTHPAFARTRENNAEFKRAAEACKLFRAAFRWLLDRVSDKSVTNRIMKVMMQVIQSDEVNLRGQRTVKDGQPQLLEGFELNADKALGNTLLGPFTATIDRNRGKRNMVVDIPPFSPAQALVSPEGATHFRLFSAGAAIDFRESTHNSATAENAYLPISARKTKRLRLTQSVKAGSSDVCFLLLGIEFLKVVGEAGASFNTEPCYNALAVVRVSDR